MVSKRNLQTCRGWFSGSMLVFRGVPDFASCRLLKPSGERISSREVGGRSCSCFSSCWPSSCQWQARSTWDFDGKNVEVLFIDISLFDTVDGWNPAPVDSWCIHFIPLFTGFYTSLVVQDSSINSIIGYMFSGNIFFGGQCNSEKCLSLMILWLHFLRGFARSLVLQKLEQWRKPWLVGFHRGL